MSSGLIRPSEKSFDDAMSWLGNAVRTCGSATKHAWEWACEKAEDALCSFLDRLGELFGPPVVISETATSTEDVKALEEREIRRIQATAEALKVELGRDPIYRFRSLDLVERKLALGRLTVGIAQALEVASIRFEMRSLKIGNRHASFVKERCVCIDESLLTAQPMSENQAVVILMGVCHECYHVFQHDAARDPERYGISVRLAKTWRDEFADYIPYSLNPWGNEEQLVERTARGFSVSVLEAAQ